MQSLRAGFSLNIGALHMGMIRWRDAAYARGDDNISSKTARNEAKPRTAFK
jgi:hypothetical protein